MRTCRVGGTVDDRAKIPAREVQDHTAAYNVCMGIFAPLVWI